MSQRNMKTLLLLSLVIVALASRADAVARCHSCRSDVDTLYCRHDQMEEECYKGGAGYSCGKYSYKYLVDAKDKNGPSEQWWETGCIPTAHCDKNVFCGKDDHLADCKVLCCHDDLCNAGSRGVVSGLLMVISSLVCLLVILK